MQRTARLAGALYLLTLPLGVFGVLYVPSALVVAGDAAATAQRILASESLYRLGIVSALALQIVFVPIVLLLYKLLEPAGRDAARLMVALLLVAIPVAMLNELNRYAVLLVLHGAGLPGPFTADQAQALVPLLLELHGHGIGIAGVFYGLWLFPLGYLVFASGFLPRTLGVLLVIAGVGHLVAFLHFSLFPDLSAALNNFTWVGELALPVWLVLKGVDVERWELRAGGISGAPTAGGPA